MLWSLVLLVCLLWVLLAACVLRDEARLRKTLIGDESNDLGEVEVNVERLAGRREARRPLPSGSNRGHASAPAGRR